MNLEVTFICGLNVEQVNVWWKPWNHNLERVKGKTFSTDQKSAFAQIKTFFFWKLTFSVGSESYSCSSVMIMSYSMNPVNLSKVEIKTEDVTNHTAIKKHTIDAILGLPRLGSCLQADDADMDGEIFLHKSNIYL